MTSSLRDRLGFALEAIPGVRRLILRHDGTKPDGRPRSINRINGHVL